MFKKSKRWLKSYILNNSFIFSYICKISLLSVFLGLSHITLNFPPLLKCDLA